MLKPVNQVRRGTVLGPSLRCARPAIEGHRATGPRLLRPRRRAVPALARASTGRRYSVRCRRRAEPAPSNTEGSSNS
jgi:hypothetical protein